MLRRLLLGLLLTGCVAAYASTPEFVYVESNIQAPNGNSILAFQRNADGTLSTVPGSPFGAGGAGVQDTSHALGPFESDQNLVVDKQRKLLFAVNSGSDTVAVFHINNDGSLTAVQGSPFSSGGTNPVSVAVRGNSLFVVNKNGDFPRVTTTGANAFPNYATFAINDDGSISNTPTAKIGVAERTSPSQALVPNGFNLLIGADFLGGMLQSFKFDDDGHMKQVGPLAMPTDLSTASPLPLGLQMHPHLPILYVGMPVAARLAVFHVSERGRFDFIRTVPNNGKAICWLRINKSGTRLYSSNTTGGGVTSTLSVYDITNPETPVEIQTPTIAGFGNARSFELSADGTALYVIAGRTNFNIPVGQGNALHVFAIQSDGTLVESQTIQIPVPVNTVSQGVAVFTPE